MTKLGRFEKRDIVGMQIAIHKTGDGLSAAVEVEPIELHVGDRGYIVMEYVVVNIQHPAEDRANPAEGGVIRKPVLDAGTMTFVLGDSIEAVTELIEMQKQKIREWDELRAGTPALDATGIRGDHILGGHDKALEDGAGVEGCALCADVMQSFSDPG
jgi:hypothetical protein